MVQINQAIIIARQYGGEDEIAIGPFDDGEQAARYGFANLEGKAEWHWLSMARPVPSEPEKDE